MATLRTNVSAVLVALCTTAALGACGNESDTAETASDTSSTSPSVSPSESPSESPSDSATDASTEPGALPACDDVWIDGQDLATDYTACTTDGETIKPVKRVCGYGATLLEQEGRFYAIRGNRIVDVGDLETSEDYQQILATCQA